MSHSAKDVYTLHDEEDLFGQELMEGDLSSDLVEEQNLLDNENPDLDDGHLEIHEEMQEMSDEITDELQYDGEVDSNQMLEPQVDLIEEQTETLTVPEYEVPRNRSIQPNILRRSHERRQQPIQRQQQTWHAEQQNHNRLTSSTKTYGSQKQQQQSQQQQVRKAVAGTTPKTNRSSLTNNGNNQQGVKRETSVQETVDQGNDNDYDDDDDDDKNDERRGCRSLICDPNGIIIAETVYRCMICCHISDSVARSQSHYYKHHMKDDERPPTSDQDPPQREPEMIDVRDEEVDDDETGEEDYSLNTSPTQLNQTGAVITYGSRGRNDQHHHKNTGSSIISNMNPSKKTSGNFVYSPSPADYVPGRNAQRALAAQNNPLNTVRGGYVTCAVCNITKYYASVQRRYGQFTCMGCAKFFGRFLIKPRRYVCPNLGSCPLDISPRCKACLLHACINTYIIDDKRMKIVNCNRPLKRSNTINLPSTTPASSSSCLPVIPKVTYSRLQSNPSPATSSSSLSFTSPSLVKVATSSATSSSGGMLLHRLQQNQNQQQFQQQKQQQHAYPTRTSSQGSPSSGLTRPGSTVSQTPTSMTASSVLLSGRKGTGCRSCANCIKDDCGQCQYCLDKPKFGGPNTLKKKCIEKRCLLTNNSPKGTGR